MISEEVSESVSEDERTEFHDRDEMCVWIGTVEGRVLRLGIFLSRTRFLWLWVLQNLL